MIRVRVSVDITRTTPEQRALERWQRACEKREREVARMMAAQLARA